MYTIRRYTPEDKEKWDAFVKEARNATFLFERGYMDYHSDRYEDCSWMAFKRSRLMALLPANITADGVLHSHQGLTYGGWILPRNHVNATDMLEIFELSVNIWKNNGIISLDYKPLPYIYCSTPSDDAEYVLFRLGAVLTEATLSSAIALDSSASPVSHYNKLRRRSLSASGKLKWQIRETKDASLMMSLARNCMIERNHPTPAHSAAEMQLLRDRFPDNIKFWILEYENKPAAAVCIYDTGRVAHAQYIATTSIGRKLNLLTPLLHYLITDIYSSRKYFDFGVSTEDHGFYLNDGLHRQKSSYGATPMLHRRFSLTL